MCFGAESVINDMITLINRVNALGDFPHQTKLGAVSAECVLMRKW